MQLAMRDELPMCLLAESPRKTNSVIDLPFASAAVPRWRCRALGMPNAPLLSVGAQLSSSASTSQPLCRGYNWVWAGARSRRR